MPLFNSRGTIKSRVSTPVLDDKTTGLLDDPNSPDVAAPNTEVDTSAGTGTGDSVIEGTTWDGVTTKVRDTEYELPSETVDVPDIAPGSDYITSESLVSGQLKTILDEGSPLMELAKKGAQADAQRSGMLDSSMAIGAGMRAMIESALPIAQGDAAAYLKANLNEQLADINLTQTGYEGDITARLEDIKGDIQKAIAEGGFASSETIQAMSNASDETIAAWNNEAANYRANITVKSQEAIVNFQESEKGKRLITELASRENISEFEAGQRLMGLQMELYSNETINNKQMANDLLTMAMQLESSEANNFLNNATEMIINVENDIASILAQPDSVVSATEKENYQAQKYIQAGQHIETLLSFYNPEMEFDWTWTTSGGQSGGIKDGKAYVDEPPEDVTQSPAAGGTTNTGGVEDWTGGTTSGPSIDNIPGAGQSGWTDEYGVFHPYSGVEEYPV